MIINKIKINLSGINIKYKNMFLVIFSAVLSNLSYPEFDLFWIQFFSLIPFLYVILSEKKLINAMLYSILFGVVFKFIYCNWIHVFHPLALPAILFGFSVFFGALGLWMKYLIIKFPRFRIFIIPSVWTGIEYFRSQGFLAFPYGLVSHSQWNFLPFIQISDIFGMWIISFLVILINTVLLEIFLDIRLKKNIKVKSTVLLILFILPLIYGFIRINHFKKRIKKGDELKIALIQPDIDPNLSWRKVKYKVLSRLTVLSERASLYNPDLIVWPESAIAEYILYYHKNAYRLKKNPKFFKVLRYTENVMRLPKDLDNYIFTGVPDYQKVIKEGKSNKNGIKEFVGEDYNSAVLIDPQGRIMDIYHKIHLVPFGEWFPYNIGFIKAILARTWAGKWTPGKRYTVFKLFKNKKAFRFAGLICYESIFGDLCRQFVLRNADFFLNITNNAWSYTRRAELQLMIASIFRTIENRVPLASSANSGATVVINQYGRVTSLFPLFKDGYLVDKIYIDKKKKMTLYSKLGDYFPKFLLIFNFLLLVYGLYKNGRVLIKAKS